MKRFSGFQFILSAILFGAVIFSSSVAYAAGESDAAVNYLVQHGIYQGDNNGNLNLDQGLTRAELAVILTRLDFADAPGEWEDGGAARFSNPKYRYNTFTDIPGWALPYIEYCYQRSLMKGVSAAQFNPQGSVTPKMACTVMLRYCCVAEADWDYDSSVTKAQSLGIAPAEGMDGEDILRGTMAVIINRSIQYAELGELPGEIIEVLPAPSQPATTSADNITTMPIDEMKAEIVRLTNMERVKAGLSELEVLPALTECAQAKAQDFLDNHYFGHTSPTYGTSSEMIRSFISNPKGTGENLKSISAWTGTVQDAFQTWMESPGHRDNILEARFTHIGIGIAVDAQGNQKWVQHFIAK